MKKLFGLTTAAALVGATLLAAPAAEARPGFYGPGYAYGGGYRGNRRGRDGAIAGAVAAGLGAALIGGAIASQNRGSYGSPYATPAYGYGYAAPGYGY